ncbi:MAG: hypothetical protein IPP96_12145 [Chitinophagaceae bacterium]|nr:hypothetical protein [Chitinophagaceae bacterium]
MKRSSLLLLAFSLSIMIIVSCKTVGRIAAKYWLNREIKEFVSNCENKAGIVVGKDNAHKYCDCAVDVVAEQYHNYQDAKNISLIELLDFVNRCK